MENKKIKCLSIKTLLNYIKNDFTYIEIYIKDFIILNNLAILK
jgi:hypothetical protein